jgi:hypothetical protein
LRRLGVILAAECDRGEAAWHWYAGLTGFNEPLPNDVPVCRFCRMTFNEAMLTGEIMDG